MPADREPTRDGAESRGLAYRAEVTWSLGGYLAVYLIGHLLVLRLVDGRAWLHLLPAGRQAEYLAQATGTDQLGHVALLSVPLLLIGTVLCYLREQDPLRGLGLGSRLGGLPLALAAGLGGAAGYLLLLGAVVLLGGHEPLQLLLGFELAFLRQWLQWRELGWLAVAVLPAAIFSYATARLLLPFGHLVPLLREGVQPAIAALVAATLFAVPYLLTPAITPLAMLNLVLLGLVLERLRVRTGSLWPGLFAFGGWVLCAELCGLPHQGMLQPAPDGFAAIPALLSGGAFGPEGGLLATLQFSVWLALLIGRERRPSQPD